MSQSSRTVLVTGCSSGIGRATARLLSEKGFRVLAGVRSSEQAAELSQPDLPTLKPFILDVTKRDHIAGAVELIRETSPEGLYGLVNNAGLGMPAAVELSTPDEVRRLLEVNTIAPLHMIQACLPLLRLVPGRVINMSSMNGTISLPMVGAYSASKFALEALSDSLRVELRPWKIPISVIRPGQIGTSIFTKAREDIERRSANIPSELKNGYDAMYAQASKFNERGIRSATSPDKVAEVVLRALEAKRPKLHYMVGLDAYGLQFAKSIIPSRLFSRILARTVNALKPLDD